MLNMRMPASSDAKKTVVFLKILTVDDGNTWQRCRRASLCTDAGHSDVWHRVWIQHLTGVGMHLERSVGGDRSGFWRGGRAHRCHRTLPKDSVRPDDFLRLLGIDTASQGLNLQRLDTFIHIDLPLERVDVTSPRAARW